MHTLRMDVESQPSDFWDLSQDVERESENVVFDFDYKLIGYRILESRLVHFFHIFCVICVGCRLSVKKEQSVQSSSEVEIIPHLHISRFLLRLIFRLLLDDFA